MYEFRYESKSIIGNIDEICEKNRIYVNPDDEAKVKKLFVTDDVMNTFPDLQVISTTHAEKGKFIATGAISELLKDISESSGLI